ncbi:hypothetical protein CBR_g25847 [Chara braunii]|uniref:EF-hand domain-containing protein n=1 Tax=Chara braunii TaxID=69332 RepID=A0A388L6I8_CHABU|nr:hypothetical protein CBR_g25847 [Chara braunii]|eukprot:GBG77916.1 hypothetical protein CBR_g25847 [Chara braunii]
MNDKEGKGTVSAEEAMQILFVRFGRSLLDSQVEEIFGNTDTNILKDLTLTEFLNSLNLSQLKQQTAKAKSMAQISLKGFRRDQAESSRSN